MEIAARPLGIPWRRLQGFDLPAIFASFLFLFFSSLFCCLFFVLCAFFLKLKDFIFLFFPEHERRIGVLDDIQASTTGFLVFLFLISSCSVDVCS